LLFVGDGNCGGLGGCPANTPAMPPTPPTTNSRLPLLAKNSSQNSMFVRLLQRRRLSHAPALAASDDGMDQAVGTINMAD
jgi:hypothetical protein